jgi:cytochrome P450
LPLIGSLLQFRRDVLGVQDAAARIGPVAKVQLAHISLYVVTDADLVHQFLVTEADSMKKTVALQYLEPVLGEGLLTAEGETHKRHRKLLAPAFAPRRLAGYGEKMVAETEAQIAKWSSGQRIDLAEQMMEMTLAIIGRTIFGTDVRHDAEQVAEGLELGMRAMMENTTAILRLGYEWPLPRHNRMRRAAKLLDEVVYRVIREGRARGTDAGDVLSMLLSASDDEGALTDAQVRDEVMTLMLAGHETTANVLTWAWYELAQRPDALARLQAEVDAAGPLHADMLEAMPYHLAVIEETMRLHPPAYSLAREATRPITIGGHTLPQGTILMANIRGIHRHADYYEAPHSFRPERFLPEAKKTRPRHHYLPFGAGPRVCIGSHFALLEAQLALATMVRRVRLHSLPGHVDPEPLVTLRPRGGMPATVEVR